METVGNRALLDAPNKVAFLSSRKIAPEDVLRCYDWAAKVRDGDACIMSGFQSPLENDVLRFLSLEFFAHNSQIHAADLRRSM